MPNSLVWHTDNMHYANMPIPIEADKPINCEQLGAHINTAKKELVGFYPVKSEFH